MDPVVYFWRRAWRRIILIGVPLLAGLAILLSLVIYGIVLWLRPSPSDRLQIAPGVFYQAIQEDSEQAKGAIIVVEVHWRTPGLRVELRPFSQRARKQDRHYTLTFADWVVPFHDDLVVFLNGTRYTPSERLRSYPGNTVSSFESVMVDGELSHLHSDSYFLWWDRDGNGFFETSKPPSKKAQQLAVMGIGVQGIHVQNGKSRHRHTAPSENDVRFPRSFIGIDPEKEILWLIAFESATNQFMSEFAAEHGVIVGGMLDASNATNMVIGKAADGIRPYTGIRNPRPLGNYITVHYEDPAEEE